MNSPFSKSRKRLVFLHLLQRRMSSQTVIYLRAYLATFCFSCQLQMKHNMIEVALIVRLDLCGKSHISLLAANAQSKGPGIMPDPQFQMILISVSAKYPESVISVESDQLIQIIVTILSLSLSLSKQSFSLSRVSTFQ